MSDIDMSDSEYQATYGDDPPQLCDTCAGDPALLVGDEWMCGDCVSARLAEDETVDVGVVKTGESIRCNCGEVLPIYTDRTMCVAFCLCGECRVWKGDK